MSTSPVEPTSVISDAASEDDTPRDSSGRFVKGVSGNPAGKPKGSKNQVTLLKLMAEEAVRERNLDRMLEVANRIIEQALDGNADSQKLVWQAIMSKGSVDDRSQGQEKLSITINSLPDSPKEVKGEIIEDNSSD